MLRRDRIIRMQIHELLDACLFMASFWLAYVLRSDPNIIDLFGLPGISAASFDRYLWLYLVIPFAPLVLESQGFYNRPLLCSRAKTAWALFKGCLITCLGLILVLFMFKLDIARAVIELLGDEGRRQRVRARLAEIIASLGGHGATRRAAEAILKILP